MAVFGPAVYEAEILEPFPKALLAASPTISGSLFRFPYGPNIGRTGGLVLTAWLLLAGELGMGMIAYLSYITPLETMVGWGIDFWLWIFAGVLGGSGIAIFTMTINVLFWA